jgi:hypothetical protein
MELVAEHKHSSLGYGGEIACDGDPAVVSLVLDMVCAGILHIGAIGLHAENNRLDTKTTT